MSFQDVSCALGSRSEEGTARARNLEVELAQQTREFEQQKQVRPAVAVRLTAVHTQADQTRQQTMLAEMRLAQEQRFEELKRKYEQEMQVRERSREKAEQDKAKLNITLDKAREDARQQRWRDEEELRRLTERLARAEQLLAERDATARETVNA